MSRPRPELEVLSFGGGGFGLDQAYLRDQEFADTVACDVVFIGLMSENIDRRVSIYRPFYVEQTGLPLTKPRFVLDAERLMLRPNPMASLADHQALLDDSKSILPLLGSSRLLLPVGLRRTHPGHLRHLAAGAFAAARLPRWSPRSRARLRPDDCATACCIHRCQARAGAVSRHYPPTPHFPDDGTARS